MRKIIVTLPDQPEQTGTLIQFGGSDKGVYAIVELEDGKVVCPYTQYVKFPKSPKRTKKGA